MLRHAIRRLLWSLPTLVAVSVPSFWFLSYVLDPTDDPAVIATMAPDELARRCGERSSSTCCALMNLSPKDVAARSAKALTAIADGAGGPGGGEGRARAPRRRGAAARHSGPRRALARQTRQGRRRPRARRGPDAPRRRDGRRRSRARRRLLDALLGRSLDRVPPEPPRTATSAASFATAAPRPPTTCASSTPTRSPKISPPSRSRGRGPRARSLVALIADVTGEEDRIQPDDGMAEAKAPVDRWSAGTSTRATLSSSRDRRASPRFHRHPLR